MREGVSRRLVFAALVAASTAASAAVVGWGALRARDGAERVLPPDATAVRSLTRPGAIVFRTVDPARPSVYGFASRTRIGGEGRREMVPLPCARIHFAAHRGLCLEPAGSLTRQRVTILDLRFGELGELTFAGIPSRTRVSPDGRYGAVTFFVTGHSYAEPGTFSTHTALIDLRRGRRITDLERFDVRRRGKRIASPDVNFWGVTFGRDSNRFYATLATRGKTYLVQGDVAARKARVVHDHVECPSLSPNGKRIAYKKRVGNGWRLHVLELETKRETALAEQRSVDDQVEWLDDRRLLYGVEGGIWVVDADGSGSPQLLVRGADSPAVLRAAPPSAATAS
jgi:hypothetical protein